MKALIEERIASLAQEYTHYFPAWTVGMERENPFTIGPVRFLTRTQWIDSVDFPESGKERFLDSPVANFRWKEILKQALLKPSVMSRFKSRIKRGNLFFIINPKRIDYEEIQGDPDPRRTAATGCPQQQGEACCSNHAECLDFTGM